MFINNHNVSMSVAAWLASDEYDHNHNPNVISTTALLRPTKSLLLEKAIREASAIDPDNTEELEVEITSMAPSRMGTGIHTAIENVWLHPNIKKTLSKLGYPESVVEHIEVNPSPYELTADPDTIPVYMEIRGKKDILGFTVTGKYDFVINGTLEDFKSTSTYSYIKQSNKDKFIKQGSIYRWLHPEVIKDDIMRIQYIFTDWSAGKAKQDPTYPASRVLSQEYPLLSLEETEQFITARLNLLIQHANSDQDAMPPCTPTELWQDEPVHKYYKDPAKKARSTKNFVNYWEAHTRYVDDGSVGEIVTIPGNVVFCRYCPAVGACNQAKSYIDAGTLIL